MNLIRVNYSVDISPKFDLATVPGKSARQKLATLESVLRPLAQVECPLKHSFADGVYIREIFIPADTLVVGKIHRHSHYNHITRGDVTVFTFEGLQHFKAPYSMVSKAGTKRAVYTHTDTVWTTVHVTNETDLAKIEAEIICADYDELDQLEAVRKQAQEWLLNREESS